MENGKERERIVISDSLINDGINNDNDSNIFSVMSNLFAETPQPDEIALEEKKPSP